MLAQRGLLTDSTTLPDAIKRQGVVRCSHGAVATVELFAVAGCVGCETQRRAGFGPGHCGIDLLGLSQSAQKTTIEIPINTIDGAIIKTGDTVEVHIQAPNARWVALACRVYAVPTLGLMLGATLGSLANELAALVLATLGLCIGLWFGRQSVQVPHSMAELEVPVQPALRIVNIAIEARN